VCEPILCAMNAKGKVAIVVGAAPGIGRATANRLAATGAAVVIADVDGDGAGRVADEIRTGGGRALPVLADVASATDVRDLIRRTEQEFGRLDILVKNAGGVGARRTSRTRPPGDGGESWR
jgi:NAD(P)-dependent dehydrogenase (short-subunit alcohol dehydrogenase family)